MAEAPTWKDHLGQIPSSQVNAPYAAGTKTLGWEQMESGERQTMARIAAEKAMHADSMALQRQKLALDDWETRMRTNLNYMEHELNKTIAERQFEAQNAMQGGITGGYTGGSLGSVQSAKQLVDSWRSQGLTPGQATTDFSLKDIMGATTREDRMR